MALQSKSLFLYGFAVTATNQYVNFKNVSGGPELTATLNLGYYSLTSLGAEIVRAMGVADPTNTYSYTVNRNVNGGLENRFTLLTSGAFLSILFSSGTQAASSVASLIGFNASDYTGATTYTGSSTCGTALVPDFQGFNYLSPDFDRKIQGSVNISASGLKETIVYQVMTFWQAEFKYEPLSKVIAQWQPFLTWAIQQRRLEFTPELSIPTVFFEGTLESTAADGKGLAYRMSEMLPNFPNFYQTGLLRFRQS